ncbi:MAG: DEAD/DEAH box helicase [Candidatus Diapherotrites archaeon]|nr:DEAD/DEAH box helicase [Candidatus Diapherotrites archaeon]
MQESQLQEIKELVLSKNGFQSFNPMQKAVLKKNWHQANLVVSAPTASGKTIIAELCALNCILRRKEKVLYTCPLKALASEHYKDWKRKYAGLGIKIAISTGDFDSSSHYLSKYDLIFTTNEKLDSLITHRASWLSNVGLLIVDEVHELASSRGATLEAVVMKMRYLLPELQIVALSATIPNASELADWLDAELVVSNYRPIKLMEGVLFSNVVYFSNNKHLELQGRNYLTALVEDTLALNKQMLFFMSTRKNAENLAKKLASTVEQKLLPKEKLYLQKLSERLLNVLENPTEQCKLLSSLAARGVAFHHAGLLPKQRELIEDAFRESKLKVVVATPTLALGVNMPAFRVVIPSLYRYTEYGMQRIPVSEYKQMAGRSGRPKYDTYGQAIIVARSEPEKDELMEYYINGMPEDISSALAFIPVLRTQLLSAIATNFIFNFDSLERFFSKSFYCMQYGSLSALIEKLHALLDDLIDYGFVVEKQERLEATLLGKRVAELYLDPESAHRMLIHLKSRLSELASLYCLVDTFEFSPWPSISKARKEQLFSELVAREEELGMDATKEYFMDENVLEKFNAALMLEDWINERSEQAIMDDYNVQPGVLYAKLQICDWLSYAACELAKLIEMRENSAKMLKLRKRLRHGVKEELLSLVELRGIGRVRARRLYRAGIKSITDVKRVNIKDLERILGRKLAESIKAQLHAR